ncbi:Gfo/Idh/MocA family protein [Aeromonas enterica]
MRKLKIAISGYGKMGKIREKFILKNHDAELIGIYEPNEELTLNVSDRSLICSSYDELLSRSPDAVFICAFNNVAAEYTKLALKAGIHVFCEKPPARTCEELKEVIETEKNSNCILKYGFNHRLHYSVIEAKKIIDSGNLGEMLWLRGVYGKAGSIDYCKNWRNYKPYSGGGILLDQGIHMLDLFHFLSGREFDVVSSVLSKCYWNVDVEDNAFITLRSDKLIATMHSSATQWRHKFLLEICFSEGYLVLDGILSESRSYTPETLIIGKREFEDITFAMGKPAEKIVWFENDDSWKKELEEFLSAVRGKGLIENGTSKDAYQVMNLVENIYRESGFYGE